MYVDYEVEDGISVVDESQLNLIAAAAAHPQPELMHTFGSVQAFLPNLRNLLSLLNAAAKRGDEAIRLSDLGVVIPSNVAEIDGVHRQIETFCIYGDGALSFTAEVLSPICSAEFDTEASIY